MQIGHHAASAIPLGDTLLVEHSFVFAERQIFQRPLAAGQSCRAASGLIEMAPLAMFQPASQLALRSRFKSCGTRERNQALIASSVRSTFLNHRSQITANLVAAQHAK
jgi:hypothetical protein